MKIDKELFDRLQLQAKASPRLRMNYDLRDSSEDGSQRMLNALEPGTVVPVHRHRTSSEVVAVLRGRMVEIFYDSEGRETERFLLEAGGELPALSIPAGRWHSLECLESGTVILEMKDGAYEPASPDDVLSR